MGVGKFDTWLPVLQSLVVTGMNGDFWKGLKKQVSGNLTILGYFSGIFSEVTNGFGRQP